MKIEIDIYRWFAIDNILVKVLQKKKKKAKHDGNCSIIVENRKSLIDNEWQITFIERYNIYLD